MKNLGRAALAALAAVSLTACANDPAPDPEPADNKPTAEQTEKSTPTSELPDKTNATHKVGDTITVTDPDSNAFATSTLLDYRADTPVPDALNTVVSEGKKISSIRVRVCNKSTDTTVSASATPWTLAYPDGTTREGGTLEVSDPALPDYTELNNGDCVQGWIDFEVGKSATPEKIRYTPPSSGTGPTNFAIPGTT